MADWLKKIRSLPNGTWHWSDLENTSKLSDGLLFCFHFESFKGPVFYLFSDLLFTATIRNVLFQLPAKIDAVFYLPHVQEGIKTRQRDQEFSQGGVNSCLGVWSLT